MLETILKIGELLRQSDGAGVPSDSVKHHLYFVPAPKSDEKKKRVVKSYSIPVSDDFSFDFGQASEINQDDAALYFFRFKTSEQDSSSPRYMVGDIYYARKEDGSESGMYRTSDETKKKSKSSFDFDKDDLRPFLKSDWIVKFRELFKKQMKDVEQYLKSRLESLDVPEDTKERGIFLHFNFGGKHWYELEGFEGVLQGIVETFFEGEANAFTLKKALYAPLSSPEKDRQFPNFNRSEQFKTRAFTIEEANNLIYAIKYIKDPTLRIKNLNVVVLPRGDNLTRKDMEAFASRRNLDDQAQAERTLARTATDPLLHALVDDVPQSVMQFDLIFREAGKNVSIDAVEISGIEKSFLSELSARVKHYRNDVIVERSNQFADADIPEDFEGIDIEKSFRHVIDGTVFDYKKTGGGGRVPQPKKLHNESHFQSHLFRVLPQIYAGAYTHDRLLLPALIGNTEYKIRNGKSNREAQDYFNFARFDHSFLTKLQVNGEQTMNELKTSPSYDAGKLLGELARPINFKIGSFSKTHVGMLTRRIADVKSLVALIVEVNEIMNRHDLTTTPRRKISSDLMLRVREMTDMDYRKDFFAFGFFESYFKQKTKEDNQTVSDEADDETTTDIV